MPSEIATESHARVFSGFPPMLLWWALIVVVFFRILWFCHYGYLARRNLKLSRTLVTSRLYGVLDEHELEAIHEKIADEVNRLVDTCLVVGTLALAAWTALFAVAAQPPGSQISSTSRALLLVGSAALIAAPVLFRVPDYHLTYMGRRTALFVGLTAVSLALASIANDLLRGHPRFVVPLAIALVVAIRDVSDTIGEIRLQAKLLVPALNTLRAERTGQGRRGLVHRAVGGVCQERRTVHYRANTCPNCLF
jgi:hypothetical protein